MLAGQVARPQAPGATLKPVGACANSCDKPRSHGLALARLRSPKLLSFHRSLAGFALGRTLRSKRSRVRVAPGPCSRIPVPAVTSVIAGIRLLRPRTGICDRICVKPEANQLLAEPIEVLLHPALHHLRTVPHASEVGVHPPDHTLAADPLGSSLSFVDTCFTPRAPRSQPATDTLTRSGAVGHCNREGSARAPAAAPPRSRTARRARPPP